MSSVEWIVLIGAAYFLTQALGLFRSKAAIIKKAIEETEFQRYYLFKVARVTGTSEYQVFHKAAEGWPVSDYMIEQDFGEYLRCAEVPYYVNDFLRKNKDHIDALKIPPFM